VGFDGVCCEYNPFEIFIYLFFLVSNKVGESSI